MRAQVQIPDVVNALIVIVGLAVLAPIIYEFVGMVTQPAGPFTALILQLAVPFLVVLLLLSVGVSAKRGGFR